MTKKRPLGLPSAKLIAFAAIAGVLAGAVAVYVKETGSGNGSEIAAAQGCETAAQAIKTLDPLIKGQVAAVVAANPPRPITGLTFKDASGADKSLQDFKGKPLLVNLWATWCLPCREEMPALNRLQQAKGGDAFEVVAINIDSGSDEKPKAFLSDNGIDHLGFYRDSSMGVFNALKKQGLAFGLPVTLVLDGKGCLLGSMNGPAVWDSEDAKTLIDKIMSL
ncbi:redoxin family protein [Agrobacterium vitis]|uniref:Redoxin family protein n=1 Tax=Agrobacterium vitis TaxID=373 RepID=A0ABD6GHW2_AGRVI|nr:TlpA disulfide reductase family protein [Agrobacterium vitis]MUO79484.1 redoxin family protein [Agrobacterium vitis]MUO95993.1 redoxin family protein [Agrobacterium vitis]MUP06611.1 redoxin family protein [Agrobacterium vitis]MUZ83412.1 redoxin family protein [Agrobacterium vitis]MVA12096.1 redoxin family protein [Agrobacterium vitis]